MMIGTTQGEELIKWWTSKYSMTLEKATQRLADLRGAKSTEITKTSREHDSICGWNKY